MHSRHTFETKLGIFIFILLFAALGIGCVYIVNYPSGTNGTAVVKRVCNPVTVPYIPPLPPVVELTEKQLKQKSLSDDALVNNIKELREWGQLANQRYQAMIETQLASCK